MSNTSPGAKSYKVVTPEDDYEGSLEVVHLYKADGSPYPNADQGDAVADVAALTQAAITGGESPTETEFNALRTDHAATRTTLNSLLASLREAGVIASE